MGATHSSPYHSLGLGMVSPAILVGTYPFHALDSDWDFLTFSVSLLTPFFSRPFCYVYLIRVGVGGTPGRGRYIGSITPTDIPIITDIIPS